MTQTEQAPLLSKHILHVWDTELTATESELLLAYQLLAPAEQQKANRFVIAIIRQRYILATAFLRRILSHYLECAPQDVCFRWGVYGKPYLADDTNIQFNLSHSHDRALVVLTRDQEVGIDIERYVARHLDVLSLADRFFSREESCALLTLPAEDRLIAFYRLWTRKEAFIKATGQGLSFGLNNFTVSFQRDDWDCLLSVEDSAKLARRWALGPILQVEPDYTAAVSTQGVIQAVHYNRVK
ncbi:MAG: hypothetical protein A3F17_05135 [Gammaproteobacteria bacterium RIFCSPHIGHO2_12_FULL_41_15]|nr:MAG: hypothetical protein A3F17_05135 [Gammaproteobacteria bacterium RIFCSPHIGHO2_12_FULL_41_15]